MTTLDHVGLSVGALDAQAAWYEHALRLRALPPLENAAAGIRTQYLVDPDGGWALELLERAGSHPGLQAGSPSEAILTRGYGHVCLRVDDVDAGYARLLEAGAVGIAPPGASPMSGLWLAFVADPEGNLIELIARPAPLGSSAGRSGLAADEPHQPGDDRDDHDHDADPDEELGRFEEHAQQKQDDADDEQDHSK